MSYFCIKCRKLCYGETSKVSEENDQKVIRICPHYEYKEERGRDTHEYIGSGPMMNGCFNGVPLVNSVVARQWDAWED